MPGIAKLFDEEFDQQLKKFQQTEKGRKELYANWPRAFRRYLSLNRHQTEVLDDLSINSLVVIQRHFRKALRMNCLIHCTTDDEGVHRLAINKPGDPLIVVCDRRGSGKRKCRWFPKDRNRFPLKF